MPPLDTDALVVHRGLPEPQGCRVEPDGTHFCIFSRNAVRVWLCLFASAESREPVWEFEFDPTKHRMGDMWSIRVENLPAGTHYMYRMDGPWQPEFGHRFDPENFLLDPFAKSFEGKVSEGTLKAVTIPIDPERHAVPMPQHRMGESVVYEVHVRGFTRHDSSSVEFPGTYRGLTEKIGYLKDLGVTTVELLPIQEMGEDRLGRCSIHGGQELINYWGYSSIGFFAPAGRYAVSGTGWDHVEEFQCMVDALHEADIEVILDVVFNHTSEGNELGPTLCFRGIDNSIYYLLDDAGGYMNYSGCGNTVNCNHPLVRDFILQCLRYWVSVMRVDGFRFDLASILSRDITGNLLHEAPLVRRIAEDPILREAKLIAEAWDAGGGYQVGSFGGKRWAEWNGRYRDDVRAYWRGDPATHANFATRLTGSADLYQHSARTPHHSINFITAHDGFTLRDLVSYEHKHNWENGEGNRDGDNHNLSFNCGVEGDTDDAAILERRLQMQRNFIATLFLSLGSPMLLGGDEFGRTQRGNNNAYCQDNEVSWFDWRLLEDYAGLHNFTRALIRFRRENPVFTRDSFLDGKLHRDDGSHYHDWTWRAPKGKAVDWHGKQSAVAAWIHAEENDGRHLYLAFNNGHKECSFELPDLPWRLRIRTAGESPIERDAAAQEVVEGRTLLVPARSLTVVDCPGETPEASS